MAQTGLSSAPGCELISGNQFMEDNYSSDHGNTAPTSTLNGTSEGLLTKLPIRISTKSVHGSKHGRCYGFVTPSALATPRDTTVSSVDSQDWNSSNPAVGATHSPVRSPSWCNAKG